MMQILEKPPTPIQAIRLLNYWPRIFLRERMPVVTTKDSRRLCCAEHTFRRLRPWVFAWAGDIMRFSTDY